MRFKAEFSNFKINYMTPVLPTKTIGPPMELEMDIDDTDAPTPFEALLALARQARVIDQIFLIRFIGRDSNGTALVNVGVASEWAARALTAHHWNMDPYDELVEAYIQSIAMY